LTAEAAIYLLCAAASLSCAALLARAYVRGRTRLLLWTSVSFGFLALNNLFLVADVLIFTSVDLYAWRAAATALALGALLYGFIWEVR
jgi:hypothetical protein